MFNTFSKHTPYQCSLAISFVASIEAKVKSTASFTESYKDK